MHHVDGKEEKRSLFVVLLFSSVQEAYGGA
jgi:hypothetical protein